MRRLRKRYWIICFSLLTGVVVSSCDLIQMKKDSGPQGGMTPVARVNNAYLYKNELSGIVLAGTPKEDSISRVEAYVDNWVRKQLLLQEAMRKININEAEVERKILEYRYSLIAYEYQTYYVKQNLDTAITEQEILQYYQDNLDNFVLKQNIVRATFIKVLKNAPRTDRIKGLVLSDREKDKADLKSYCLSFAAAYHIGDSSWIPFDELVRNSPLAEIPNKVQFLKSNQYYETNDDNYLYFLSIGEYRILDEVSPIEFVRSDIRNIIQNKRKVELARKLENEVYDNAVKQKTFEIYR